jgi:hypothetical protein
LLGKVSRQSNALQTAKDVGHALLIHTDLGECTAATDLAIAIAIASASLYTLKHLRIWHCLYRMSPDHLRHPILKYLIQQPRPQRKLAEVHLRSRRRALRSVQFMD